MKVALVSFQFEANTFINAKTYYDDFDICRGVELLPLVPCLDVFSNAGVETVPVLYANAVPGPTLDKDSFLRIAEEIISGVPVDVDGVWMYLHGSMYVEELMSGEFYLCRKLREKLGETAILSLALDLHASIDPRMMDDVNIVCGYRTAPHIDQFETQWRAAELLVKCLRESLIPHPVHVKIPIMAPGEMIMTDYEPMKHVIAKLRSLDLSENILTASFFAGHFWVDAPHNGACAVVTSADNNGKALEICREIAAIYWDNRDKIEFQQPMYSPEEALHEAFSANESPVFISDTGDNATAGSPADNAWYLDFVQSHGYESVLFAGITDKPAVSKCRDVAIGGSVILVVGASIDPSGTKAMLKGTLKSFKTVPTWSSTEGCAAAVIESGSNCVILTEVAVPFIEKAVFDSAGVSFNDYKAVVLKSGYLFEEIAKYTDLSLFALTPGGSYAGICDLPFCNIPRPMYPMDKNARFS